MNDVAVDEQRYLEAFASLAQVGSTSELIAALRVFDESDANQVESMLAGIRRGALATDRAEELARLTSYAPVIRFVCERGIDALEDVMIRRVPAELRDAHASIAHELARYERGRSRPDPLVNALGELIASPAFGSGSAAFRRSILEARARLLEHWFDMSGSLAHLELARAHREKALAGLPMFLEEASDSSNGLAINHLRMFDRTGKPEELEAALRWLEANLASDPSNLPAARNYATALKKRFERTNDPRDLDTAIAMLEQTAPRGDAAGLEALASALFARFTARGSFADLDRSIAYLEAAIEGTPPDSLDHMRRAANLGRALVHRLGVRRTALDMARSVEVLDYAARNAPRGTDLRLDALGTLADAYEARFAYTDSLSDSNASLALREQIVAEVPRGTSLHANALYGLAALYYRSYLHRRKQGVAERAEELLRAVVEISAGLPRLHAAARESLARLALETDDYAKARRLVAEAAGLATSTQDRLRIHRRWARAAVAAEAWQDAAGAGERALDAATELADAQPDDRSALLARRATTGLATTVAYACAKSGEPARAVAALERGRCYLGARALEVLRRQLAPILAGPQASLASRYLELLEDADDLPATRAVARTVGDLIDQRARREELELRRDAQRRERDQLVEEIRALPGGANFLRPMSFTQIQHRARCAGIPIVYLAATAREGFAVVVRADSVETIWLAITERDVQTLLFKRKPESEWTDDERFELHGDRLSFLELGGLKDALRLDEAPSPFAASVDRTPSRTAMKSGLLAAQLGWVPLRRAVEDAIARLQDLLAPLASIPERSLVLVPCGALALLPVHAVLPDRTIRHALSAALLGEPAPTTIAATRVIAVADTRPHTAPLAWSRDEAAEVVAVAGRGEALVGAQATRRRVLAELGDAAVLHFACHGEYDADDPLAARIHLAGDDVLDARTVQRLSLPHVRLVTLAACRTAVTDHAHVPDESLGLATSFATAGVSAVIGSLWQVDDRASRLLMGELYRRCRDGADVAAALSGAIAWLRALGGDPRDAAGLSRDIESRHAGDDPPTEDGPPFAHPYYWAPFVLHGW